MSHSPFYEIPVKTISGQEILMKEFQGKALLIVNVASFCGFTKQYEGLEALYRKYQDKGFAVLGFPCNQFGEQEPDDEASIQNFCSTKYQVTFPMFAKVDVNGSQAHPLYKYLKANAKGLLGSEGIKWNFTKFLVSPSGEVVTRYAPQTTPEAIEIDVQNQLPK